MPSTIEQDSHHDVMEEMSENSEDSEFDDSPLPVKFRNYNPVDETLKKYILVQPEIPNIAKEIDLKLSKVIEANKTCNVLNLAPKKANWDLKRDLSKKMEILEQRTQKAIAEMVRQKFQGNTQK